MSNGQSPEEINKKLQDIGIDYIFISNINPPDNKNENGGGWGLFKCLLCNNSTPHRKAKLLQGRGRCSHCKNNNTKLKLLSKQSQVNRKNNKILSLGFKFIQEAPGANKAVFECLTCHSQYTKRYEKITTGRFTCCKNKEGDGHHQSHNEAIRKIRKVMDPYFIIHKMCNNMKEVVSLECRACFHKFDRFGGTIIYPSGRTKRQSTRCPKCKYPDKKVKKIKTKRTSTSFSNYEYIVKRISNANNDLYLHLDNNRQNHMDHNYSIKDGFDNGIEPWIVGSPVNLRLLPYQENLSKHSSSHITLLELYKSFFEWSGNNSDYFEKVGILGMLMMTDLEENFSLGIS